jgi:RNA polymerase sigma-70 factor, ECF subfamily
MDDRAGARGAFDARYLAFLSTVEELRPSLHRYCARMTGSVADGEDVVQDALFDAYRRLESFDGTRPLKPWLFRIAHNRCVDFLRHRGVREDAESSADTPDVVWQDDPPGPALGRAVEHLVLTLPPMERACVLLKDVLDHSLDEIGVELGLSVPAVKAALHRARTALAAEGAPPPQSPREVSAGLQRYAALFNAHDWDGVRALLADDVKLDLVSRRKLVGREVSTYFSNYAGVSGWRVAPAWLDGDEVLAVWLAGDARPAYFIALRWQENRVCAIRDHRYVPYIAQEAAFRFVD